MLKEERHHFIKSTVIVAICAFLSRVLGLFRSTLLASFFGATESEGFSDCYAASFKLPDIIFNLVAFGAISIVLIPYFSGFIKNENFQKLKKACSQFLNFFFLFISFFIIIGFLFTPIFVRYFLVKGWSNEHNIDITITMTRILLLQSLFMTLSGIFGAYLNALERFKAYSFALLSYNIGIIFGILFLTPYLSIIGVAWGAVIGSLLHFLIQAFGSIKNGFIYQFGLPKMNKEIKELIFIAIPRVIAISGEQLVKFFIVYFASYLFIGSIFIFENAENFAMVPFGMIAVSISTTVFPVFSKLYAGNENDELLKQLLNKLRTTLFFMMPISILMIIFKIEIVELLLAYNKFSENDAIITSNALAFYMIGIPFFSISIVIVKFYYALKKSLTPMVVTLISVFFTIFTCYLFSIKYNVTGLSIGRSIGYIIQTLLLILFLFYINKKEKLFKSLKIGYIIDSFKIIFICIFMLIIGLILQLKIKFVEMEKINDLLKILIIGCGFIVFYIIVCYYFKIPEVEIILKNIKNKFNFKKN